SHEREGPQREDSQKESSPCRQKNPVATKSLNNRKKEWWATDLRQVPPTHLEKRRSCVIAVTRVLIERPHSRPWMQRAGFPGAAARFAAKCPRPSMASSVTSSCANIPTVAARLAAGAGAMLAPGPGGASLRRDRVPAVSCRGRLRRSSLSAAPSFPRP